MNRACATPAVDQAEGQFPSVHTLEVLACPGVMNAMRSFFEITADLAERSRQRRTERRTSGQFEQPAQVDFKHQK